MRAMDMIDTVNMWYNISIITYLSQSNSNSGEQTVGLELYRIFQEFILESNNTFQKVLRVDKRFIVYLHLCIGTDNVSF